MAEPKQESRAPLHVVVFPWLAFGHIIPFLELSVHLAKRGHFVTFVSAPRNLARLRPVPPELRPRVRLLPLALPRVEGLPDGAESTADVPPEKVELLKVAFDGLAAPFAAFLAEACSGGGEAAGEGHGRKPDWIVPCAMFLIFPAAAVAFIGPKELNDAHPRTAAEDFTVPPPWIPFPYPIAFRRHEAEWLVRAACQPNASGASDMERFWKILEHRPCPLLVCRCSREVDGPLCSLLGNLYGKPVLPAGLLAPYDAARAATSNEAAGGNDDEETASLMRWLDAQPERSVLYVAFGSEAPLTPEHVRALALGLELAGVRFVWALRETSGGGLLPDGFEARVREAGRGVVRVGWVPQVRVLAHAAVGAFMTHAGLSSLMESFLFGHPIVMLPLFADQGLTARLMTERRVGLEVPRGDDCSGSFGGEDVAATVRRVMVDEGAEVFARNARERKLPSMAESKKESSPLHVVVFPWLAFGHIIPFLELSEQLAKRGHFVTFVSAPRNLAKLRPVLPEVRPRIRLAPLSLPHVEGLPDGAESTADVPPEKVELLKVAFDGLAAPFAAFLAEACAGGVEAAGEGHGKKPDWIILDFAHHWLPPIAEEHEARGSVTVPCAVFFIFPAAFVAFMGTKELNDAHPRSVAEDFTVPPPWIPSPSGLAFRGQEAEWIAGACRPNASGVSDTGRFWETARRCPLIVCRCSREVDGTLCSLLGDIYGKPVLPSGLLAPYDAAVRASAAGAAADGERDDDEDTAGLMRWLDAQPERSVLYVAFGSEAPLTPGHVHALALGLELAGVRFLWALRKPIGEDQSPFPDGFEGRVAGRGVVRVGWVPQVRVLAHAAVGAFMTHAGWSSLMESFLFGHPLVMLPLFADQGLTARLMTERQVGLEVPWDDSGSSFGGEDVARTVRLVMAEEEGNVLRQKAREFQEVLWDTARQQSYIDELVDHLLQRRGE
ncbi:putative UDP-rhamnose:rhamnosyltransferase 1 [Dichanthelium oligosanthes]|uniref:Putative UDP-rhamnose:rhamnosyltransferase 1 n=1 Tax=Dichanthelium oligosanthes TaxID=888268 RepID=A0A1E5UVW9_9POAL|nr:putative UDP-rhamnose:rhamnosyltransferase 1 [Dichanthelium oligosanthes]